MAVLLTLLDLRDSFLGTRVEKRLEGTGVEEDKWPDVTSVVTLTRRVGNATLHRDVTFIGALEARLSGRQARRSVPISSASFVDVAGVTAKIDGRACPSVSVLEARPAKVTAEGGKEAHCGGQAWR
jgi:hypothetical protein